MNWDEMTAWFEQVWKSIVAFAGREILIQVACILGGGLIAWIVGRIIARRLERRFEKRLAGEGWKAAAFNRLLNLCVPLCVYVVMLLSSLALGAYEQETRIVEIASGLAGAWILARLAAMFIRERFWYRLVATMVWLVVALDILGLRSPLVDFLEGLGVTINDTTISVWSLSKALIILFILIRVSLWVSRLFDSYMSQATNLNASVRVLVSKGMKILLLCVAGLVALQSVGIDLSTLAVLGGAVGVGIGFGLQKVVSNLVSGVILLLDRSIKPGDVIQVGETLGSISKLQARYVSVVTRDGQEFLIPNEDLITSQVINLSFTDTRCRLRVPVGVAYDTDLRLAMKLMAEAATNVPRILSSPAPVTQIKGFGDSSVDLELRFWINDPQNGVANIKTVVMLRIWDAFQEHGVSIPFPQREVRILGNGE